MPYPTSPGNTTTFLSGRALVAACLKADPLERTLLMARLSAGEFALEHLTSAQAAKLGRISTYYVTLFLQILDRPKLVDSVLRADISLHEAVARKAEFSRVVTPPQPLPGQPLGQPAPATEVEAVLANTSGQVLAGILNGRLNKILEIATASFN